MTMVVNMLGRPITTCHAGSATTATAAAAAAGNDDGNDMDEGIAATTAATNDNEVEASTSTRGDNNNVNGVESTGPTHPAMTMMMEMTWMKMLPLLLLLTTTTMQRVPLLLLWQQQLALPALWPSFCNCRVAQLSCWPGLWWAKAATRSVHSCMGMHL